MRDNPSPEERADAPARSIEELIRHDNIERLVFVLQAADRARRQDPLDAEHLETVDIRAEIQLRWQKAMADAVAREERHPPAAQRPDHVGTGRIAERRRDLPLLTVGQLRHVVEPTAADDSNRRIRHAG